MSLITHCFTSTGNASSDDMRRKADRFLVAAASRHCSVKGVVVEDDIHMFKVKCVLCSDHFGLSRSFELTWDNGRLDGQRPSRS